MTRLSFVYYPYQSDSPYIFLFLFHKKTVVRKVILLRVQS